MVLPHANKQLNQGTDSLPVLGERAGVRGATGFTSALPPHPAPLPRKAGGEGVAFLMLLSLHSRLLTHLALKCRLVYWTATTCRSRPPPRRTFAAVPRDRRRMPIRD